MRSTTAKKGGGVKAAHAVRNGKADDVDLRILYAIRKIIRAVDMDSHHLAAQFQITGTQLICLMAVVEQGTATSIAVARRVHLGASTIVGVMDRLEAKGFVERRRNPEDRRAVIVTPTAAGRSLVARTPYPLQYSLEQATRGLPRGDREEMAAAMERLVQLMGAEDVDASPMLEIAGLSAKAK